MPKCDCGTKSINPSLPKELHSWYCSLLRPSSNNYKEWNEFLYEMNNYGWINEYCLYVTDDEEKLSHEINRKVSAYVCRSNEAKKCLEQTKFVKVYIEMDCDDYEKIYDIAVDTQEKHATIIIAQPIEDIIDSSDHFPF
jgi:hypothetical protein